MRASLRSAMVEPPEDRADASDRPEGATATDPFGICGETIGDQYRLQLPAAEQAGTLYTLTGTFTFGDPERNAIVGARLVAFDEMTAVSVAGKPSKVTMAPDRKFWPLIVIRVVSMTSQVGATDSTSGGGGAPAGFDSTVTHVRYTFSGTLSTSAPDNTFNVRFGVRIR